MAIQIVPKREKMAVQMNFENTIQTFKQQIFKIQHENVVILFYFIL